LCDSREGQISCHRGRILASSAIALLIAAVAVNGIIELPIKQEAFAAALIDFNIRVAGDWGKESETRNTARNMADHGVELALLLRDLAYEEGSSGINDWYNNYIDPIKNIAKASQGNYDERSGTDLYHRLFNHPNNQWLYSMKHQNVFILSLNT
jgi:hypothetical protein